MYLDTKEDKKKKQEEKSTMELLKELYKMLNTKKTKQKRDVSDFY